MNYTEFIVYALYVFAAAFLAAGFFRIIEFKAAGVSRKQRLFLIPLHIVGTCVFTAAIILLARDKFAEKTYLHWAFGGGIAILLPLHIYLGLKRRILMKDR